HKSACTRTLTVRFTRSMDAVSTWFPAGNDTAGEPVPSGPVMFEDQLTPELSQDCPPVGPGTRAASRTGSVATNRSPSIGLVTSSDPPNQGDMLIAAWSK